MYNLDRKINEVGIENCYVSEITVAELYYGAVKSNKPQENTKLIDELTQNIAVLPLSNVLLLYAQEKV